MSGWTDARVTAALGLGANANADGVTYGGISTDTRSLRAGDLFVALRGDAHDAHAFLGQAAAAGATGAVVDHVPANAPALRYYVVQDTLNALGQLGRHHRHVVGARVCAVAGSNGKTTTKELLRAVLSAKYRVHATGGNFNNLVGAPLTLLATPDDAEVVVAEIGTNTPGEIARLGAIVEPDAAVITGISAEHLEGLGDLDGVLREECSILPWLPRTGVAVVADEPVILPEHARLLRASVIVAGLSERATAAARGSAAKLDHEGRVSFRWRDQDVTLKLRGLHNARNALIALALGEAWGVPAADAIAALERLQPPKMRTEFHHYGELTVIADCYNANPASTAAAIDLLAAMPRQGGRVAVLGSMLELGPQSAAIHAESARAIADHELDLVVATGAFAEAFEPLRRELGERLVTESDPLAAYERLEPVLSGTEVVLLKGSRGVALERLLPRFEAKWGSLHPHGEAYGSRATDSVTASREDARAAERPHASSTRPRSDAAAGDREA